MVEGTGATGLYERAEHAARVIRARTKLEPRIGIVLGSGLGSFADDFDEPVGIPYEEIPGFMRSTAEGHAGRLVIGKVDAVPLLAMQGRVHYYEGYSLEEVTFPIRTFNLLGEVDAVPLLAMQGRVHYYEGYSLEEVTFPIRTFNLLGVKTLILTNASGGINVQLSQGTLMVISDHLNLMGDNPLRGPNEERIVAHQIEM